MSTPASAADSFCSAAALFGDRATSRIAMRALSACARRSASCSDGRRLSRSITSPCAYTAPRLLTPTNPATIAATVNRPLIMKIFTATGLSANQLTPSPPQAPAPACAPPCASRPRAVRIADRPRAVRDAAYSSCPPPRRAPGPPPAPKPARASPSGPARRPRACPRRACRPRTCVSPQASAPECAPRCVSGSRAPRVAAYRSRRRLRCVRSVRPPRDADRPRAAPVKDFLGACRKAIERV